MTVTGIIAEYNPLHKGHEYQLKEARRLTGADYIIVVMSGCFTQRGTPAVLDKYDRAHMALSCGADLVLELPTRFACASAEYFASGAVSVLNRLGCVDYLCFGSECGDTQALRSAATLLSRAEKSPEYQHSLREAQKGGLSFPAARSRALESSRGTFSESFSEADASLFSLPNNILGIEYCRALDVLKSPIRPITIRRRGNYHDTELKEAHGGATSIKASSTPDAPFSSASAIRTALKNTGSSDTDAPGPEESLFSSLPDTSRRLLFERSDGRGIVTEEDFSSLLRYRLLQLMEEGAPAENGIRTASSAALTAFADVTPSLADKIVRHLYSFTGWDDFCLRLRSRDLPYVRASRSLCHILLNLKQDALDESKAEGFPVYLRMLGFSERALPLLTAIKKEAASPLLSRLTTAREQLSLKLLPLLEEEIRASHIYQTIVSGKYGTPFLHEYQRQILCPPFNS